MNTTPTYKQAQVDHWRLRNSWTPMVDLSDKEYERVSLVFQKSGQYGHIIVEFHIYNPDKWMNRAGAAFENNLLNALVEYLAAPRSNTMSSYSGGMTSQQIYVRVTPWNTERLREWLSIEVSK